MVDVIAGLCLGILAGWLIVAGMVLVTASAWLTLRLVRKALELHKTLTEVLKNE